MSKQIFRKWLLILSPLLLMAISIALTVSLYRAQYNTIRLQLTNRIEGIYSDLLVAESEGSDAVIETMDSEDVDAFGYYLRDERPTLVWGINCPDTLKLDFFTETNIPYYEESDAIGYDSRDHQIECIKYFTGSDMNNGRIFKAELYDANSGPITYIAFNGEFYIREFHYVRKMLVFGLIFLILPYIFLILILKRNITYREYEKDQRAYVIMGQATRTFVHEIKNPLSVIMLDLALLRRIMKDDSRYENELTIIENEVRKIKDVTDNISLFLKNKVGKPEVIDVVSSIKELLPRFPSDTIFREHGLNSVYIEFDRDRFVTVIENLVNNAIEAVKDSGSQMKISIDIKESILKRRLYILIKDNGCGIKDEDLPKIFDPFFTTKLHAVGLGLSLARYFVTAAGGKLNIERLKEGGTMATIVLDIKRKGIQ